MERLLRYWNQNKKKILITIAVIALVIVVTQIANAMIRQQNIADMNKPKNNIKVAEDLTKPNQSIITETKLKEEVVEDNSKLIKDFVTYCNQKKYQEAFQVLSSSCKKEVFNNDINMFIQNYVSKIFNTDTTYNISLWTTGNDNYTYQIKYYENSLLATGGINTNKNVEDYITIVKENSQNKLNIKNFILYENINKTVTQNDIEIAIHDRKIYKTYEQYSITIKNNSKNTISVSVANNEEDIQLVDKNGAKYNSLLYEIPQHFFNIKSRYQSNIDVSFNKAYNVYRKTESMEFKSIILNYEDYINNQNKEVEKVTIDIKM